MEENKDRVLFIKSEEYDYEKSDIMVTQHENGKVELVYNKFVERDFDNNDSNDYRSCFNECANNSYSQKYDNLKDFGISLGNENFGFHVPLWQFMTVSDLQRFYLRAKDGRRIEDFREKFSNFIMDLVN